MGEVRRLRFLVTGSVQGVGFRFFTQRTARALGISGWVRNLPDGSVEVEAEGDPRALEALRGALAKGPPSARVTRVDAFELPLEGGGKKGGGFQIR